MQRRRFNTLAAGAFVAAPWLARAQGRPIRLIVPFPAGGATDLLARAISQRVAQDLNTVIVVDNKAGAGGTLGSAEAAKAAPDGLTLLIATSSTHSIAPHLNSRLSYKPDSDFTPIALVATATNLMLVPNDLPVKNLREFIAYAKQRPGQLNYASSGNGTIVHLTSEAFKAQSGLFITHIPYRGTALAIPDLASNKVQLLFDSIVSGLPHVREGRLKALAVTSAKRSALVPDVPTCNEAGLPGFESTTWFGIYGPKGLSTELTMRFNAEFNKAMQSKDVQERLAKLGAEVVPPGTPAQFAALVAADSKRWGDLIRDRKITVE